MCMLYVYTKYTVDKQVCSYRILQGYLLLYIGIILAILDSSGKIPLDNDVLNMIDMIIVLKFHLQHI